MRKAVRVSLVVVLLAACCLGVVKTSSAVAAQPAGVIAGHVNDGTRGQRAGAGIVVVLRVMVDGQLVGGAQTVTDDEGSFRFDELPLGHDGYYLPGANLGEVHFPGPRTWLSDHESTAEVDLTVYDCVTETNPLTVDNHRVEIKAEPGRLVVREVMQIRNDSRTCYVGKPLRNTQVPEMKNTTLPVTLVLGVPQNFERVTFDEEAFGRRFQLIGDQLVTDLPWPPGVRELAFTYAVPLNDTRPQWTRLMRLPTREFDLRVRGEPAERITCNLDQAEVVGDETVRFVAPSAGLDRDAVVRIEIGEISVPAIVWARRLAVVVLGSGVLGAVVLSRRRSGKTKG